MNKHIKRGVIVWVIAGVLLLAWFTFAVGVNAANEDQASDEISQVEKRERFYRVVSGEISGDAPGPLNRLARDLRELPTEDVGSFAGDNNRYGGISEELGFDPFNSPDCSECGPLDSDVIADVVTIKQGGIDEVIENLFESVEPADTLSGPPDFLWLIWLLALPIEVGAFYISQRRSEEDKYRDFAEERKLISELQMTKGDFLPNSREWRELDSLESRLKEQIETRVSYRKSKTQAMKIDYLTSEANSALEAIAAGNKELD